MGGYNCAVYGCHCSYSRSPGVTFFNISKLKAGDADAKSAAEWRQRLIIACARDPPFNKDKAHICSRHFTSACLMPVGGYELKVKLKPLSVPTEYLPEKSVHVEKPLPRKPPADRGRGEKTVECFDIDCDHIKSREKCRFYKWPVKKDLLKKWQIISERRPDCERDANSRLCSCHFEEHKKANGPTFFKSSKHEKVNLPKRRSRKILAEPWDDTTQDASPSAADTSLPVTLLSPHCNSHMAKTFTTGAMLLPDGASFTMGFNKQDETMSQMEHDGVVLPQADCKSSALNAMDGSLDGGYTISVKTEGVKSDLIKEETLRIIEPRHWTVNDRGVLVNADESEVMVKVEKPDLTTENVMVDSSTIISRQDAIDAKDGILTVKEEYTHIQRIKI